MVCVEVQQSRTALEFVVVQPWTVVVDAICPACHVQAAQCHVVEHLALQHLRFVVLLVVLDQIFLVVVACQDQQIFVLVWVTRHKTAQLLLLILVALHQHSQDPHFQQRVSAQEDGTLLLTVMAQIHSNQHQQQ